MVSYITFLHTMIKSLLSYFFSQLISHSAEASHKSCHELLEGMLESPTKSAPLTTFMNQNTHQVPVIIPWPQGCSGKANSSAQIHSPSTAKGGQCVLQIQIQQLSRRESHFLTTATKRSPSYSSQAVGMHPCDPT